MLRRNRNRTGTAARSLRCVRAAGRGQAAAGASVVAGMSCRSDRIATLRAGPVARTGKDRWRQSTTSCVKPGLRRGTWVPGSTLSMQNDFVSPGGALLVSDAEPTVPRLRGLTVPRLRGLIERAREHSARIVFTQDTHEDGDPGVGDLARTRAPGQLGLGDRLNARAGCGRHRDHQGSLRRLLRHAPRPPAAPMAHRHAGDLRHGRQHLRPLHRRQRGPALVSGGHPHDATSALDPFDFESSLRQTAFLFAGQVTSTQGIVWAPDEGQRR